MLDGDQDRGLLDHVQSCFFEEFGEVTFARSGEVRLSFAVVIEFVCRVPEEAEWSFAAGMIPDAGGHDSFLAGHPDHFAQTRDGVTHEVNDELREAGIEDLVLERDPFGRGSSHVDRGITGVAAATNVSEGSMAPTAVGPRRLTSSAVNAPGPIRHRGHAVRR